MRARRQTGIAAITALLLVAIIATIAISLSFGQQIWIRQTENLTDLSQAEILRRGAMEYAAVMLRKDAQDSKTNQTDDLTELWAKQFPPLPVDKGFIRIGIEDAQARFNLNNLVNGGAVVEAQRAVYERLLVFNQLDPKLVDALVDWMDGDETALADGAEDVDYLNQESPYRAANRPLASVDELRLIKGYTDDIVNTLRPYVITLPANVQSPVNVNTASDLLIAAFTGMGLGEAKALVIARDRTPFKDGGAFAKALPNGAKTAVAYDVRTSYFIVSVAVQVGRVQRETEGLIERIHGQATLPKVLWYRLPPLKIVIDDEQNET